MTHPAERTLKLGLVSNLDARVPVTAKLSRRFYEKLGDDVANELVEWFNTVDSTYKAELREFNELNFARFDAKLEQRLAHLEAAVATTVANTRSDLLKWMVGLWLTSALSFAGIALTLWRLR